MQSDEIISCEARLVCMDVYLYFWGFGASAHLYNHFIVLEQSRRFIHGLSPKGLVAETSKGRYPTLEIRLC